MLHSGYLSNGIISYNSLIEWIILISVGGEDRQSAQIHLAMISFLRCYIVWVLCVRQNSMDFSKIKRSSCAIFLEELSLLTGYFWGTGNFWYNELSLFITNNFHKVTSEGKIGVGLDIW